MSQCHEHLLPNSFFKNSITYFFSRCPTPLLSHKPMVVAARSAITNPNAAGHVPWLLTRWKGCSHSPPPCRTVRSQRPGWSVSHSQPQQNVSLLGNGRLQGENQNKNWSVCMETSQPHKSRQFRTTDGISLAIKQDVLTHTTMRVA